MYCLMRDEVRKVWERIFRRRRAYRHIFKGEFANIVLADLKRFSRYGQPPISTDDKGATDMYKTGLIAGRQEVFSRILHHLHISDEKLINMRDDVAED